MGTLQAQPSVPKVSFTVPADASVAANEGHLLISWDWAQRDATSALDRLDDIQFRLERSETPDFAKVHPRYLGTDLGTYISGLAERVHYFRVRAESMNGAQVGAWSAPLTVEVRYVDRTQVYWMLGMGLVIFLATCALIIIGHLNTRNSLEEGAKHD